MLATSPAAGVGLVAFETVTDARSVTLSPAVP
jgi:hypothetical protein